jgi:enoyl-CoA hydratase
MPAVSYRDYQALQFDTPEPGVLRIVLSNPGKLNAVTPEMHKELASIWLDVDQDPEVRVVIVTGADGAFSAGGELSMVERMVGDQEARLRTMREARDIVYNLVNCTKPVISAIDGPAVGAGLAVALLADISIATPRARIVDGHTRLGVAAGDHAVMIWPLLCGMAKARYYLLTCEPVSGEEAERIGLVSLCVPEDELADKALEVARRLATGAQSAIRWTKLALNNWLRQAGPLFDVSVAYELCGFGGPDVVEGVASLREKRAPKFTGPAAE